MFKQALDVGQAGDQLGALVRGVKREDVKRGMVLCAPGSVTSHTQLKAQVILRSAYTVLYNNNNNNNNNNNHNNNNNEKH